MYTMLARWYVKQGMEQDALTALEQLAAQVQAQEPDTLMYLVHRGGPGALPPSPRGEIVFVEGYRSMEAFKAHVNGPVFQGFLKEHGGLFVPAFQGGPFMLTEPLDRVAGFVRG